MLAVQDPRRAYAQWMTPAWAAAELVERHFADLTADDLVIEPSCGRGAFLHAIVREEDGKELARLRTTWARRP